MWPYSPSAAPTQHKSMLFFCLFCFCFFVLANFRFNILDQKPLWLHQGTIVTFWEEPHLNGFLRLFGPNFIKIDPKLWKLEAVIDIVNRRTDKACPGSKCWVTIWNLFHCRAKVLFFFACAGVRVAIQNKLSFHWTKWFPYSRTCPGFIVYFFHRN